MTLDDIQKDIDLVNEIDWDMGPEDAVTMYLEWGNNPALGNRRVRSKNDYSTYFVVNTWKKPVIYLIRRNSEAAEELAAFEMPDDIEARFMESVGHHKGVYAIEGEVKDWLKDYLFN
jgi:hypothetical protein